MQITFLGATDTVTGSKYLLSIDNNLILIDCGLFQGAKSLRLRNWDLPPFDPKKLKAVVLTHAHIDHSGYLPLLVRQGFRGPIYCSQGTQDLCHILLPDSAHLQEEDAKHANINAYSKHKPALPLYTLEDAEQALKQFKPFDYHQKVFLDNETAFEFIPAGHIIGASLVCLHHQGRSILFSGDLGRLHDPVMRAPSIIHQADYLIVESTYGNRLHETEHPKILLKNIIDKTIARGGSVIIPAFAVGRTQTILYYLSELKKENAIQDVPIYLDSPMAINATQILCQHINDLRVDLQKSRAICDTAKYIRKAADSKNLDRDKSPKIILSASGMATGGRILFHLATYGPDEKNTILFTGYQSQGTRGGDMLKGVKTIKIHGKMIPIQAEIAGIHSLSAHADYQEILQWLKHFTKAPQKTFITHGEPEAALSLKDKIEAELGWTCMIPHYGQTETLI